MGTGRLYIVATPIGNMEDMTLRSIRLLKEVGLIAAEDTRHSRNLMRHYGISTPLTSYHEHNEKTRGPELIRKLETGVDVALITDAGTPGISDPGYRLVRLASVHSIPVVPVPGPSALTALLSVAGLPTDTFTFLGFVPTATGRRRDFFLALKGTSGTYVVYETARRIRKTIEVIKEVLGDVELALGRELTKLHEEVIRGAASEVLDRLGGAEVRGEITLIIRTSAREVEPDILKEEIERLLRSGHRLKEVARALAGEYGLPKAEVYKEALAIKERLGL